MASRITRQTAQASGRVTRSSGRANQPTEGSSTDQKTSKRPAKSKAKKSGGQTAPRPKPRPTKGMQKNDSAAETSEAVPPTRLAPVPEDEAPNVLRAPTPHPPLHSDLENKTPQRELDHVPEEEAPNALDVPTATAEAVVNPIVEEETAEDQRSPPSPTLPPAAPAFLDDPEETEDMERWLAGDEQMPSVEDQVDAQCKEDFDKLVDKLPVDDPEQQHSDNDTPDAPRAKARQQHHNDDIDMLDHPIPSNVLVSDLQQPLDRAAPQHKQHTQTPLPDIPQYLFPRIDLLRKQRERLYKQSKQRQGEQPQLNSDNLDEFVDLTNHRSGEDSGDDGEYDDYEETVAQQAKEFARKRELDRRLQTQEEADAEDERDFEADAELEEELDARKGKGKGKGKGKETAEQESEDDEQEALDREGDEDESESESEKGEGKGHRKKGPLDQKARDAILELKRKVMKRVEAIAQESQKPATLIYKRLFNLAAHPRKKSAWNAWQTWAYDPEGGNLNFPQSLSKAESGKQARQKFYDQLDEAGVPEEDRANSAVVFERLPWLEEWIANYEAAILDAREQSGTKGRSVQAYATELAKTSQRAWDESRVHVLGYVISTQGESKSFGASPMVQALKQREQGKNKAIVKEWESKLHVLEMEAAGKGAAEDTVVQRQLSLSYPRESNSDRWRDHARTFLKDCLLTDIIGIRVKRGELTPADALAQSDLQMSWGSWADFAYKNQFSLVNWDDVMAQKGEYPKQGFKVNRFSAEALKRILPAVAARHGIPVEDGEEDGEDGEEDGEDSKNGEDSSDDSSDDEEKDEDEGEEDDEEDGEGSNTKVHKNKGKKVEKITSADALKVVPWSDEDIHLPLAEQARVPLVVARSGSILVTVADSRKWTAAVKKEKDQSKKAQQKKLKQAEKVAKTASGPSKKRARSTSPHPSPAPPDDSEDHESSKPPTKKTRFEEEQVEEEERVLKYRFRFFVGEERSSVFYAAVTETAARNSKAREALRVWKEDKQKWVKLSMRYSLEMTDEESKVYWEARDEVDL